MNDELDLNVPVEDEELEVKKEVEADLEDDDDWDDAEGPKPAKAATKEEGDISLDELEDEEAKAGKVNNLAVDDEGNPQF